MAYSKLESRLQALFSLNPDLPDEEVKTLYELAELAGEDHLDNVLRLAESLLDAYLKSPPKRVENELFSEYFAELERSAFLLKQQGAIDLDRTPGADTSTQRHKSFALVHRDLYSTVDRCKIMHHAGISRELFLAVEACRRRNELLTSVLEYISGVMLRMDRDRSFEWQERILEKWRDNLDPDIARDFLNVWLSQPSIPRTLLSWAEQWSGDVQLYEQWPAVSQKSDKLLCQHALRAWKSQLKPGNARTAHLALMVGRENLTDNALLHWLKGALLDIGESVARFMELCSSDAPEKNRDCLSASMIREIRRIDSLFVPILLTADQIIRTPDGPYQFALAFFGLVGSGQETWRRALERFAANVVRRMFMSNMRKGNKPDTVIRPLTFGDQTAYLSIMAELDWDTQEFDSLAQRDKVVHRLAAFYASYREPKLLAAEITKRYRNLMRLMHEDNLRRVLLPKHAEAALQLEIVRELSSAAADARKFLSTRRALNHELEEMVAAELDFVQSVRLRRLRIIHNLLPVSPEHGGREAEP